MTEVKLLSLNIRGLQDSKKRREIFTWLKQNHKGSKSFILLQETHSKKEDELVWKNVGHKFCSHMAPHKVEV